MKFFSLINTSSKSFTKGKSKIIPKESFTTLMDAHEMQQEVKKDIEELKKKIEEERIDTLAKAKEEGKLEGLFRFNEMLVFFDRELKAIRHEMSKQIMPLALKAAKKIVGTQLAVNPATIVDIVLQALGPITENRHIILYVNKDDKQYIDQSKDRIMQLLPQIESFSIQESKDIEAGGCRIWTETGFINVELENQWKALERAFEKFSS